MRAILHSAATNANNGVAAVSVLCVFAASRPPSAALAFCESCKASLAECTATKEPARATATQAPPHSQRLKLWPAVKVCGGHRDGEGCCTAGCAKNSLSVRENARARKSGQQLEQANACAHACAAVNGTHAMLPLAYCHSHNKQRAVLHIGPALGGP